MHTLPILDLFLLAVIKRGLRTPYDLQRTLGVSLGSSTPALRRLSNAGFVQLKPDESQGKRPRNTYTVTAKGDAELKKGWMDHLQARIPGDIDSVLRLAFLAGASKRPSKDVKRYLQRAADERQRLAKSRKAEAEAGFRNAANSAEAEFLAMRFFCDAARLQAEGKALSALAKRLK